MDKFPPKPLGKVLLLVGVGMLAGLFGIAQLLQLLGVIGVGFSGLGLALTAISFVIAVVCFKHASAPG